MLGFAHVTQNSRNDFIDTSQPSRNDSNMSLKFTLFACPEPGALGDDGRRGDFQRSNPPVLMASVNRLEFHKTPKKNVPLRHKRRAAIGKTLPSRQRLSR